MNYDERIKVLVKFMEWCDQNGATYKGITFLEFLEANGAINIDNCRELIKDPEVVTDKITIDSFKEVLNDIKEKNTSLHLIIDGINNNIRLWGANGRLIDRTTVINLLSEIKDEAKKALKVGAPDAE